MRYAAKALRPVDLIRGAASPRTICGVSLAWTAEAAFQLGNALSALSAAALDFTHEPN